MRDAVALPSPPVVCIIYSPDVPACLIGIQVNGVADVEALLGTWTRGEPTFYDEFEPAHGNDGHTTADELAVELARYVDDNDDGVVYSGPELNASTVGAALETMLQRQRVAGAAHGVSRRSGQWRAPGARQREALVLWRVVAAQAARRVAPPSRAEMAPSEEGLCAALARYARRAATALPHALVPRAPRRGLAHAGRPAARPGGRRRRVNQPRRAVAGAACAVAAHGLRAKMRRLLPSHFIIKKLTLFIFIYYNKG